MKALFLIGILIVPLLAQAQLAVTVLPLKVMGQKALIPLAMKNGLSEPIESARAVVFLLDEQGKMVGQGTRWIIGGSQNKLGLAAGATNSFYFVIENTRPFAHTNLTPKVSLTRVVLKGGKAVDISKDVIVLPVSK